MHKISTLIALILAPFLMVSLLGAVELDWEHDYNKALAQAKQEKKLVYLFIGADTCKYCAKFKDMTLSKTDLITMMKKDFVLLYMSRDQHTIPDKFEEYGVPRHYFLTPEGEILDEEQGIWDPKGWESILQDILSER